MQSSRFLIQVYVVGNRLWMETNCVAFGGSRYVCVCNFLAVSVTGSAGDMYIGPSFVGSRYSYLVMCLRSNRRRPHVDMA
jgi:hypothetical protein